MKKPELAKNEKERIEILESLNILDTNPEERFDRFTRLAKKIFDTPIALVSLIDQKRQWFKSSFGLAASETSKDISFCGHAILYDDIFIVNDTFEDERFRDNPLVLEDPYIRFYAGVPLFYNKDIKLGTLCIIDTKPREFTKKELEPLRDLAILAQQQIISSQLIISDELTGITNRRGFNILAQKALNISYREKKPSVLVFFDLNKFKDINDSFGHTEGDNVLKLFSKNMENTFRESDIFARIGGDEFIVLLSNINYDDANMLINRFERSFDKFNQSKQKYQITFSSGILEINLEENLSLEELTKKVDKLMYENKSMIND
jgi:diguanylate cyclase (GGDEF)-like protein